MLLSDTVPSFLRVASDVCSLTRVADGRTTITQLRLPVVVWDERYSSQDARAEIEVMGVTAKKRTLINQLAAENILQVCAVAVLPHCWRRCVCDTADGGMRLRGGMDENPQSFLDGFHDPVTYARPSAGQPFPVGDGLPHPDAGFEDS